MTPGELLRGADALLLDFDGPICSVFAGISAATVAEQLRVVLADGGHATLPRAAAMAEDPFDLFRYAASLGREEACYVEAAFTAHEVEAIATAAPTPGAHGLIQAWHNCGRQLAVVSNNSSVAIGAYLDLYNLRPVVDVISARTDANAKHLKPSPHLLQKAVSALHVEPNRCVFLGDSLTDVQAARAAGIACIGYVNKQQKLASFRSAGLANLVTNMSSLAASLS